MRFGDHCTFFESVNLHVVMVRQTVIQHSEGCSTAEYPGCVGNKGSSACWLIECMYIPAC